VPLHPAHDPVHEFEVGLHRLHAGRGVRHRPQVQQADISLQRRAQELVHDRWQREDGHLLGGEAEETDHGGAHARGQRVLSPLFPPRGEHLDAAVAVTLLPQPLRRLIDQPLVPQHVRAFKDDGRWGIKPLEGIEFPGQPLGAQAAVVLGAEDGREPRLPGRGDIGREEAKP